VHSQIVAFAKMIPANSCHGSVIERRYRIPCFYGDRRRGKLRHVLGAGQFIMRESSRAALLSALIEGYDELKRRLARRLGSSDMAGEALQDTFIRLECGNDVGTVRSPRAYLFRTALNMAANRRVSENRRVATSEVDALLAVPDDAPDPARIIEARSDIEALERVLRQLPVRQRDIVRATFIEEESIHDIAKRYGVSVRTVQIELREALLYCAERLDRPLARRTTVRPRAVLLPHPVLAVWPLCATAEDSG